MTLHRRLAVARMLRPTREAGPRTLWLGKCESSTRNSAVALRLTRSRPRKRRPGNRMSAKRALIVDDSRSARTFLTRVLERYDLQVDSAASAEEAIEYLIRLRPDVIF